MEVQIVIIGIACSVLLVVQTVVFVILLRRNSNKIKAEMLNYMENGLRHVNKRVDGLSKSELDFFNRYIRPMQRRGEDDDNRNDH